MFTSEGCSLPIGSCCFSIPIQVHWSFFLLLVLELLAAITRYGELSYTMLVLVLYGPVLLGTIIVHELGHALMNRRFGGEADKIVLWPLGGFVVLGRTEGLDVMEDFWVAVAGPLTHIPMVALWFVLFLTVHSPSDFNPWGTLYFFELNTAKGWFASLFEKAAMLNIVLFVFNLFVPAYPLDGGRCLVALLVKCGTPVPKTATITSATAMLLACGMIAYAVVGLVRDASGGGSVLLILIAIWIFYNSYNLYRLTRDDKVNEHPMFAKECYRRAGAGATESRAVQEPVRNTNVDRYTGSEPAVAASSSVSGTPISSTPSVELTGLPPRQQKSGGGIPSWVTPTGSSAQNEGTRGSLSFAGHLKKAFARKSSKGETDNDDANYVV